MRILLPVLITLILTSCQKQMEPVETGNIKQSLSFEMVFEGDTKATETRFEVGDTAGLYVNNFTGGTYTENAKVVYDGTKWVPIKPIYWTDNEQLTFILYYPYNITTNQGIFFETSTNQSIAKNYYRSQYIWGIRHDVNYGTTKIEVKCQHMLNSFEVRLRAGNRVSTSELKDIITSTQIESVESQCYMNPNWVNSNNIERTFGNNSTIKSYRVNDSTFRTFVIPQNKTSIFTSLTVAGKPFTFHSSINYSTGGKRFVWDFIVTRNSNGELSVFRNIRRTVFNSNIAPVAYNTTLQVNGTAAFDLEIDPAAKSWLKVASIEQDAGNWIVDFDVNNNTGGEMRSAKIKVTSGTSSEIMTINQHAARTIHVATPMTFLATVNSLNLLGNLPYLKITGSVDFYDITVIQGMHDIKYLDLSDANFVENEYQRWFINTRLQYIILPNSLTYINERAMFGCNFLLWVSIPSGVSSIQNEAFYWCTRLRYIDCHATTPPTIDKRTFYDTNNTKKLRVPAGSVDAYKANASWAAAFNNGNNIEAL